ncbi:MAG: amidohydrolase family protein [Sphingobacteriaceae bacterium]|nr:amidohydrolase family protein [Sphingobacteriaceae bacterium]
MKSKINLFLLLFFITHAQAQNIVLRNVNILPINHNITIPGCNVFIRDGKIEKITPFPYVREPGKRAKKKESTVGYVVHDCGGAYLMPGLADMHGHLPEKNDPIKLQQYLNLQLAAGVTLVRSMRGKKEHLAIRDSVKKGIKANAPELCVSFLLNENDTVMDKGKAENIVKEVSQNGFDFIKYLHGLDEASFKNLVEACKQYTVAIAGHAYQNNFEKTFAAGFRSIEHYQPVLKLFKDDTVKFKQLIPELKKSAVGICPTLSYYYIYSFDMKEEVLNARNGMNFLSTKIKKEWGKSYKEDLTRAKEHFKTDFESKYVKPSKSKIESFFPVLKLMANEDVNLLLSPDDGPYNVPGFSVYEEMMLYKKAGLSNYQILKCATLNAARCLNDNTWGSVEIGKKANLVLLSGNPLDDLSNIKKVEAIILHGKYILPEDLVKQPK